jgi:hypothetical protein
VDNPQQMVTLDQWLRQIESKNGIARYFLWIQWQEKSAPLPQGARFPEIWPAKLRRSIEFVSRPIAKADVELTLNTYANDPIEVLVTPDPNALLGWTPLNDYFT